MALINYELHQIDLKIVYCGPPSAGKSSSLRYLHRSLVPPPEREIVTLRTGADRTLLFEFDPQSTTLLDGFRTRCQLYTVPGRVELNVPHHLVLRDVDALVFVADSLWSAAAENLGSLMRLEANLKRHQLSLETIPLVLQFNKRDLPDAAPVHYLEFLLNRRDARAPSFESSAVTGKGVFAALNAALGLAVRHFHETRPDEHPAGSLGR